MALERLHDRIVMIDHRPATGDIGIGNVWPHLQPEPSQDAVQHRKPGDLWQHEVKCLIELRAFQAVSRRDRLLVFVQNTLQSLDIRTRRHLRSRFRGKPFQANANRADFPVAAFAEAGNANVARRAENDRLVIGKPEDGVADRRDARAELLGEIADLQAVAGLKPPLDQSIAQRPINGAVEVLIFQCCEFRHGINPEIE